MPSLANSALPPPTPTPLVSSTCRDPSHFFLFTVIVSEWRQWVRYRRSNSAQRVEEEDAPKDLATLIMEAASKKSGLGQITDDDDEHDRAFKALTRRRRREAAGRAATPHIDQTCFVTQESAPPNVHGLPLLPHGHYQQGGEAFSRLVIYVHYFGRIVLRVPRRRRWFFELFGREVGVLGPHQHIRSRREQARRVWVWIRGHITSHAAPRRRHQSRAGTNEAR